VCDPPESCTGTSGGCPPDAFRPDNTPCTDDGNECTQDVCLSGACQHLPTSDTSTCSNPILGSATECTVFEINGGTVDLKGPLGPVDGNVCIGPGGSLLMSGSTAITGDVLFSDDPGKFTKTGGASVGGTVKFGQDLSGLIADAQATETSVAGKPCTPGFSWDGTSAKTFDATNGSTDETVICVTNVNLGGGKVLRLTGDAGDKFIIKVTGSFRLSGGADIQVDGANVQSGDVLVAVLGTGGAVRADVGCVIDGSLLALHRDIDLKGGFVNGQIFSGQNISIVSGARVTCPPCVP